MTIETQQGKKSWIGDGSTTNYPYSYPFLNASDIEVYLDGEKQASGFSVQNKPDYSTGANIIFDVAPAEGVLIVIRRNVPMTQEISYPENGEFPAKSHEKSLDKLTMLIIDNNKETLKVGPATPEDFDATFPVPEANKALKITADGKGFTMSDYDPDTALALTEDFKNQAQQAAIDALSSQTVAANSEQVALQQAQNATTQAANAKAYADNAAELNQQLTNNFNTYNSSLQNDFNTYNSSLQNDFNTYNSSLQNDFNTYTGNLINTKEDGMASLANASNALRQTQITNCILEIPQRIKFELVDSTTILLKAGSILIVPNGFEEDGITPKFDDYVLQEDKLFSFTPNRTGNCLVYLDVSNNYFLFSASSGNNTRYFSGETAPIDFTGTNYGNWYDTKNNLMKYTLDGGLNWSSGHSLPFASISYVDTGSITGINQIFNGFGYIGSTIWIDKGVKGLYPNGRNEDRTLNNIEYTTSNLILRTFVDNWTNSYYLFFGGTKFSVEATNIFNNDLNLTKLNAGIHVGFLRLESGVVTLFSTKQPFRTVDYNDASRLGMPSNKYINLTLGASGATYTAPANGWFAVIQVNNSNGQLNLYSNKTNIGQMIYLVSGVAGKASIPVKKGDTVIYQYVGRNPNSADNAFRFIYAEGEV